MRNTFSLAGLALGIGVLALMACTHSQATAAANTAADAEAQASAALTIRIQAEVFDYYDQLVKRWEKREAKTIASAWDAKYKAHFGRSDDDGVALTGVADFEKQAAWKGTFTTGWDRVLVSSMTQNGDQIVVKGFEEGSWRLFDGDDVTDGGASFSHSFKDTWVKKSGKYLLTKSEPGAYKELTEEQLANLTKTHATLGKTLKSSSKS